MFYPMVEFSWFCFPENVKDTFVFKILTSVLELVLNVIVLL